MYGSRRREAILSVNRLEGAAQKPVETGVPMCIAETDESGNSIAFERMNGGKISSISIAQDKACTAAAVRKSTHEYNAVRILGELAFRIRTEVADAYAQLAGKCPWSLKARSSARLAQVQEHRNWRLRCATNRLHLD